MIVDEFKNLNEKLKMGFINPQQFNEQWDELVKRKNELERINKIKQTIIK